VQAQKASLNREAFFMVFSSLLHGRREACPERGTSRRARTLRLHSVQAQKASLK